MTTPKSFKKPNKEKQIRACKRPGRPKVPPHLKRVRMTGVRIQQWILDWLMSQPGSKGQLIEKLLIEKRDIEKH